MCSGEAQTSFTIFAMQPEGNLTEQEVGKVMLDIGHNEPRCEEAAFQCQTLGTACFPQAQTQ